MELRYWASQISRGLLGSTPSGRHSHGLCWTLVFATVDHGAKLLFCTIIESISESTHSSCEART